MHLELMRSAERSFPTLADPSAVKSAKIWHCKFRTLVHLAELTNLHTLVVATYPDPSLDVVGRLSQLRYLSILHLPKVQDLAPLASLSELEVLSLCTTPGWDSSGKKTAVRSLEPIAGLRSLRHLELIGVVPESGSLAELERCEGLISARFGKFKKAEVERFYGATGLANDFAPEPEFDGA